ncbi:hypothetical protein NE235_30215 [Actinoallomurus spadix]|uniref:Uncharacterized protein n=1 Tax=Actinoallomurus spadix TaxID=79912 RepID=A0ABP3G1S8_9ACTN|nr:hypothetical protein [Actinoallomurus spadix]MCO5990395.1 hypothetical protein [Actinoallomurus spadix]
MAFPGDKQQPGGWGPPQPPQSPYGPAEDQASHGGSLFERAQGPGPSNDADPADPYGGTSSFDAYAAEEPGGYGPETRSLGRDAAGGYGTGSGGPAGIPFGDAGRYDAPGGYPPSGGYDAPSGYDGPGGYNASGGYDGGPGGPGGPGRYGDVPGSGGQDALAFSPGGDEPSGGGRKKPLVIGAAVAASVVVIGGGAAFALSSGGDDPKPKPSAAASKPAAAPPQTPTANPTPTPTETGKGLQLASRTTDPKPLTVSEVFKNRRFKAGGRTYVLTTRRSDTKCANGVHGTTFRKALVKAKCTQVLRATYSNGKFVGTIGIVNLKTDSAARAAQRASRPKDAYVLPLPGAGTTSKIGKGLSLTTADPEGHYLIMSWVQYPNGKKIARSDYAGVTAFVHNATIGSNLRPALNYRSMVGKPA